MPHGRHNDGVTDLVVRGGTVVTAGGSRRPTSRSTAGGSRPSSPTSAGRRPRADEVVDATGLLVLPGVVDVHTHTRVASDAEPDRFFQDSVAAAFGGTTTFLSFNNPGTGSSPGGRAIAADRASASGAPRPTATARSTTACASRSAATPTTRSPSCRRRSTPASPPRRRSWSSTSGCADAARCSMRCGVMGAHGGMLQVHCEDPVLLDAAVAAALAAW